MGEIVEIKGRYRRDMREIVRYRSPAGSRSASAIGW